jgi:hypothetical protein
LVEYRADRQVDVQPHLLQLLDLGHANQAVQRMRKQVPAAGIRRFSAGQGY